MKEVNINLHNIRNCICGKCPSFPGKLKELAHADMPGLFCSHGKSKLEIDENGCICADCDVQIEHELSGEYYCARGQAEA